MRPDELVPDLSPSEAKGEPQVKQPEELLSLGGKFYALGNEAWCDLPLTSWKLLPGVGYICQD